jgi:hypothetical protein
MIGHMRAPQLPLAVFALLLLAVGAWYVTRGDAPGEAAAVELEAEGGLEQDSALSPGGLADAPQPVDLGVVPVTSERTAAVEEAVDADPLKTIQRAVIGRVVDGFGKPVAGARVLGGHSSGFGEIPLERLANMDGALGRIEEGKTDREGRFRLETSMRGELRFVVRASGFAPLRTRRGVTGGDEAKLADFVLEQGAILRGYVVDEAGTGIPDVAIDAVEAAGADLFTVSFVAGGQEPQTRSGVGGAFELNELAVGPYLLRLAHPEHPDLKVEGAADRPGQASTGLRLVMKRGYTIAGRVSGLGPGQASELKVRAVPTTGVDLDLFGALGGARVAELGADGSFELRGLSEGKFRLNAIDATEEDSIFAEARSAVTMAETGQRDVNIELRKPSGVTLRVLDATTGAPVTRYQVETGNFRLQALENSQGMQWCEWPDGKGTFADIPSEDLPIGGRGGTRFVVSAVGYESLTLTGIEPVPGSIVDLGDVRLTPVATITVRVVDDATGELVEGARVSLREVEESLPQGERRVSMGINPSSGESFVMPGQEGSSQGRTDEEGVAELPSLPGKLCSLGVKHRSYAEYRVEAVMLPEQGGLELEARLSKGGTVIVTVLGADGEPKQGVRVQHSGAEEDVTRVIGGGMGSRKSNSKGIVKFAHLAEGLHHFEIQEGTDRMIVNSGSTLVMAGFPVGEKSAHGRSVEVREGSSTEITLHARPEGIVSGRVTEAGEPLVGASISFDEDSGSDESTHLRMLGFGGGPSARTDSQGRYSVDALKVGDYLMKISHPRRVMPASLEISVREGENQVDQDLPVAILEGRVTDPEGKPVAGITVKANRYSESESGEVQRTVVSSIIVGDGSGGAMSITTGDPESSDTLTDVDGRYVLRGVQHDVELYVEASSSQYQRARSEPVTCGENQTRRDVDIEVYEAGHVRVAALDADGAPMGMCLVELEFVGDADPMPAPARGFIADTGETTVDSLRPGRWRVSARTIGMMGPTGGDEERIAAPVEVDIVATETAEVTLDFLE